MKKGKPGTKGVGGTRKGKGGDAANYITRAQALKKLQLSLADFRRLCILKGVYPRDPKKKAGGKDKTYYALKDILFIMHEPVLEKLREMRAHKNKTVKAKAKKDNFKVELLEKSKPFILLDRLVKERFPTFVDAVRDMDDALSMATLFANLPSTETIESKRTLNCRRLVHEFINYVVMSKSLRKVFLSIKGCYFQASIQGQDVTWLIPYEFVQELPGDVDYRVMMTFLEFYETQLHFINYKLYSSLGFKYPPKSDTALDAANVGIRAFRVEKKAGAGVITNGAQPPAEDGGDLEQLDPAQRKAMAGKVKALKKKFNKIERDATQAPGAGADAPERDLDAEMGGNDDEEDDAEAGGKDAGVLGGLKIFLSREVPRQLLEVMAGAFGAQVGWEGAGSPFTEADQSITHQVVDRDTQRHLFLSREYVQPQWLADTVNAGVLMPAAPYGPGCVPPPHISPFVNDDEEGYVPDQKKFILDLQEKSRSHAGTFAEQEPAEGKQDGANSDEDEDEVDDDDEGDRSAKVGEIEDKFQQELAQERGTPGAAAAAAGGVPRTGSGSKKRSKAEVEEERARMMMPKKDRRLYDKIKFAQGRKADRVSVLEKKAEAKKKDGTVKKSKTQ
jgi:pescadillo